jgi:hypothetical protein
MRINLTVEVASAFALQRILQSGMIESGLHCSTLPGSIVTDSKIVSAHKRTPPARLVTDDYWKAPSGEGPQAATWKDKPHRLVYDLVREVERLRALLLPAP